MNTDDRINRVEYYFEYRIASRIRYIAFCTPLENHPLGRHSVTLRNVLPTCSFHCCFTNALNGAGAIRSAAGAGSLTPLRGSIISSESLCKLDLYWTTSVRSRYEKE